MPLVKQAKPGDDIYGIPKDLTYETIFFTNLNKKDVVLKTFQVLETIGFKDLDSTKIENITESMQSFTYPTGQAFGLSAGKGGTFGKRLKNPVILFFDLTFDFLEKDNGSQVKIQLTNFEELAFFKINDMKKFHVEGMIAATNSTTAC